MTLSRIEMEAMDAIIRHLPRIAQALERIVDALEAEVPSDGPGWSPPTESGI